MNITMFKKDLFLHNSIFLDTKIQIRHFQLEDDSCTFYQLNLTNSHLIFYCYNFRSQMIIERIFIINGIKIPNLFMKKKKRDQEGHVL